MLAVADHPSSSVNPELTILTFPDPALRKKGKKVKKVTDTETTIAKRMAYTMYSNEGIGLAATQVNFQKNIIVMDTSEERDDLYVMINPEIVARSGTTRTNEACLSVPGLRASVNRSEDIIVKYVDIAGEEIEEEFNDIKSYCIQHEIDHLNGKILIDYISN